MPDLPSDERALHDVLVTSVRWALIVAGLAATVPVMISLLLRQVDVASPRVVGYVAATPFVIAVGVVAILLLAAARWWTGLAGAGALTMILALTQVPMYLGSTPPDGPAVETRVMTVNLHFGRGDAEDLVRLVDERDVDVLALEELTFAARSALEVAGLDELLPYSVATPDGGVSGNGLWSRHRLDALPPAGGFTHTPVAASMDVEGQRVFVAVVHPTSPYPNDTALWASDFDHLAAWLSTVEGPVIVAGDFNATSDHRPFRDVLATGLRDAAEQVGAGFLPTYPAGRRRVPLLITIDHVLSGGGIVAVDFQRVEVIGTDHAGVVATLAVPLEVGTQS